MEKEKNIAFSLPSISIEQFATLEENYTENGETNIQTEIEFGFDDASMMGCFVGFTFTQNELTFLKIKVGCHFSLKKGTWEHLLNENKEEVTFPAEFMARIAAITVCTTRGILFARTENSQFSRFIIPFIKVEEMINEDVSFIRK